MRKILSAFFGCILLLLVLLTVPLKTVFADGVMIRIPHDDTSWNYSDETNQEVFINYEAGLQKMVIAVEGQTNNNERIFWIFPVPADPEKVTIDIVKKLPDFEGSRIKEKAAYNLKAARKFLSNTQIYPVLNPLSSLITGVADFQSSKTPGGVSVYDHLEKEGLTTEIITAKNSSGLYDYLSNKGLDINENSLTSFDYYMGRDYSFIVSWVTQPTNNWGIKHFTSAIDSSKEPTNINRVSIQKGLYITFPVKKIYFPLMPTSIYGSKIIPVTLRVLGLVSPEIFNDIKNYTTVEYFTDGNISNVSYLKGFFNKVKMGPIRYTKIVIEAPSKLLTEDLWIKSKPPIGIWLISFIADHIFLSKVIYLAVCSFITGIVAGFITLKPLRKKIFKLGIVGLSNCFSILGLIVATHYLKVSNYSNLNNTVTITRIKGHAFWRRFIGTLMLIVSLFYSIGSIYWINTLLSKKTLWMESTIIPNPVSLLVPFLFLALSVKMVYPKPNDSCTLNISENDQQLGQRKISFVILYSFLFLFNNWVLFFLSLYLIAIMPIGGLPASNLEINPF